MATAPNYCCGGWALVTSRTNETTLVLSEALIRLSLYHPRIWPSLSFNDFLIRKYVFRFSSFYHNSSLVVVLLLHHFCFFNCLSLFSTKKKSCWCVFISHQYNKWKGRCDLNSDDWMALEKRKSAINILVKHCAN